MKVSASILSDKYSPFELIQKLNNTNVDYIHLDIMDGKFVNNKTWSISEIKKITKNCNKPLDCHLMVKNPIKYIEDLATLNTLYITFHYEATKNIDEVIDLIKSYGLKVGISIKPNTNVKDILPYLSSLDLVLVMSVEPGASGQEFMESVLYKIEVLRKVIDTNNLKTVIEVDGGINDYYAKILKEKGADILVSASYIHEGNMEEKINSLRC